VADVVHFLEPHPHGLQQDLEDLEAAELKDNSVQVQEQQTKETLEDRLVEQTKPVAAVEELAHLEDQTADPEEMEFNQL
jgi:hypothetical protein